jgi:hypothetical protein
MAKLVTTKHPNIGKSLRRSFYPSMLEFAIRSKHVRLKDALLNHYKFMLENDPCSEIMGLVDLVDRVRVPELFGLTYFTMLHLSWDKCKFNLLRKARLYRGHYELTRLWDELHETPLAIQHCCCTNGTGNNNPVGATCQASWSELWSHLTRDTTVLAKLSFDVIERLRQMATLLDSSFKPFQTYSSLRKVRVQNGVLEADFAIG